MKVSVIVPTYNGAHKLPGIVKALQLQTLQPSEVIVVIDGSTDNSIEVLKDIVPCFPSLTFHEQENRGRAAVRNKGAMLASGDLLVFFDDDMEPAPYCIEEHVKHHRRHPGTILTGAQIEKTGSDRTDLQNYKAHLSETWSRYLIQTNGNALTEDQLFITAANFSIAKDTFFQLKGFDERLTDAEDFDLAVRAFSNGVSLYYKHKAFAWHNDPITGPSYIRRLRQYYAAQQLLRKLKPEIYENITKFSAPKIRGFRKMFFSFFTNVYWIKQTEGGWIKHLPTVARYKLYDIIVTANGVIFPDKVNLIDKGSKQPVDRVK